MDDAAEGWLRRARKLNPDHVFAFERLTRLYEERGDLQRARTKVESFLETHPNHPDGLRLAAEVSLYADELEQAKEYLEQVPSARRQRFSEGSPSQPDQVALGIIDRMNLGLVESRLGNGKRGSKLLSGAVDSFRADLEREKSDPARDHALLAAGLAALGQTEAALRHLSQAVEKGYPFVGWLQMHPLDENVRSEPQFKAILRQAELNQQQYRKQVRWLGIDLYPPGAEPDTVAQEAQADE